MSNEKQETMADIIVEMRHGLDKSLHDIDREWAHGLSDRIETAWRREMAKVEANALEVGGIVAAARTAEKSSAVGNAAAMREALVQCERFLGNVSRHGHPKFCFGDQCTACNGADELMGVVVGALAEPPRNCDIYTTSEDADRAITEHCSKMAETGECVKSCPHREANGGCAFGWFFAPAERKREKAEIEADALAVGGIVEAARHKPVGNAAAMREACQKMRDLLMLRGDGKAWCVLTWDEFNESQKMLRAALSAPARNCDRPECDTSKAAQNVWRKEDGGKTPYYEWLLAPEAERKGENNGSK